MGDSRQEKFRAQVLFRRQKESMEKRRRDNKI